MSDSRFSALPLPVWLLLMIGSALGYCDPAEAKDTLPPPLTRAQVHALGEFQTLYSIFQEAECRHSQTLKRGRGVTFNDENLLTRLRQASIEAEPTGKPEKPKYRLQERRYQIKLPSRASFELRLAEETENWVIGDQVKAWSLESPWLLSIRSPHPCDGPARIIRDERSSEAAQAANNDPYGSSVATHFLMPEMPEPLRLERAPRVRSVREIYAPLGRSDAEIAGLERFAHEPSPSTPKVRVGIVDTGIDYNHPTLAYRIDRERIGSNCTLPGQLPYDFPTVSDKGEPRGHGTATADLASRGNPHVLLHAIKIFDTENNGEDLYTETAGREYQAIAEAFRQGVRIFNLSLGGSHRFLSELERAVQAHPEALFVFAAGNERTDVDGTQPIRAKRRKYAFQNKLACPGNCVRVASVDRLGYLSFFSNYGTQSVDLAAPGEEIVAAEPGGGASRHDGTSLSAPQVANAAAWMLAIDPTLAPSEIIEILGRTASRIPELEGKLRYGGTLNLEAAILETQRRIQNQIH